MLLFISVAAVSLLGILFLGLNLFRIPAYSVLYIFVAIVFVGVAAIASVPAWKRKWHINEILRHGNRFEAEVLEVIHKEGEMDRLKVKAYVYGQEKVLTAECDKFFSTGYQAGNMVKVAVFGEEAVVVPGSLFNI